MPRGDRTGPMGNGELTGRGMGFCAGFSSPGFSNDSSIFFGLGRKFARFGNATQGFMGRMGKFQNSDNTNNKEFLKRRKEVLEQELEKINSALNKE